MQLCDAFDLPIVSLVDCPGIMVGPEIEKTALVRHASRVFVTCTSLTVPLFAFVLRKGYGLGAQAMTGGGFKASAFTVTWPTGEFGGMGLEGAVKLGYRKELEAIEDTEARKEEYENELRKCTTAVRPSTLPRPLKSTRSSTPKKPAIGSWPASNRHLNPCLAKVRNGRLSILGK